MIEFSKILVDKLGTGAQAMGAQAIKTRNVIAPAGMNMIVLADGDRLALGFACSARNKYPATSPSIF